MASNESTDSFASFLEQLINSRNRDLSFFLPFILGVSNSASTTRRDGEGGERETESSDESDQEGLENQSQPQQQTRDRIVLINPLTQGMIVIESSRSLEALLRELSNKDGPKPATKASIEAMPKIIITEKEDEEKECSICLDGWEIGGEAREMPCKHIYHSSCIEKWLGIHGNCPVCRYKMPVDEEDTKKSSTSTTIGDADEENRGGRRNEIWVSFSITGRRDSEDGNATEE